MYNIKYTNVTSIKNCSNLSLRGNPSHFSHYKKNVGETWEYVIMIKVPTNNENEKMLTSLSISYLVKKLKKRQPLVKWNGVKQRKKGGKKWGPRDTSNEGPVYFYPLQCKLARNKHMGMK